MNRVGRHPILRRRVIIIFLITVLFPVIFLGYLGLTGIQKERDQQEQLVKKNLENTLSLAVKQVETAIIDHIRSIFNSIPPHTPINNLDVNKQIQSIPEQFDLVDNIFVLDEQHRVLYPVPFRGEFVHMEVEDRQDIIQSGYLREGELLEIQGLYADALQKYIEGKRVADSRELDLTFLLRIARCEIKLYRYEEALQTYYKIISLPAEQWYKFQVPYPLIAYLQIILIKEQIHPQQLMKVVLDFYEFLLDYHYMFDRAQYDFYLENIHSYLEKTDGSHSGEIYDRVKILIFREMDIKNNNKMRSVIESEVVPQISKRPLRIFDSIEPRFETIKVDEAEWLLAVRSSEGDPDRQKISIIILNSTVFQDFLSDIIDTYNYDHDFRIVLMDRNNMITLPIGNFIDRVVMSKSVPFFTSINPYFELGLILPENISIDSLFGQNVLIYYIIIVSIIVVIVLGVFFVFRDIYREEELSRIKSEFISNVSHEIKTPISTIRALSENLEHGWVTENEKRREYYKLITRESGRLSHLVENILDFSRIEAQKKTYRLEPVAIKSVIERTIERFRTISDSENITLDVEYSPQLPIVNIESNSIEQAILNLLDNAVKYSDEKKVVHISAGVRNGELLISITDNGVGIKKEDLKRIFEKFYRAESLSGKKVSGSGIGLSLVKEIMEVHGGKVNVESEVNKGSTFILHLPLTDENDYEKDSIN
jgi:signal transduction histidine kinase